MKERPILFSAPMVRAILGGSKTQTRRIVKPQPDYFACGWPCVFGKECFMRNCIMSHKDNKHLTALKSPFGKTGDQLWVRETWRHTASSLDEARAITEDVMSGSAVDWRADYIDRLIKTGEFTRNTAEVACDFETWKPSIHMPRWASRIQLEIVDVRVERLNEIGESDAIAEGVSNFGNITDQSTGEIDRDAVDAYRDLWESINGPGSWDANPWVWVIEFRRVLCE